MAEDYIPIFISKKLLHEKEIIKLKDNGYSLTPIESYQLIKIEAYALLILDKKTEGMYSDIKYRSEDQFDTIAFFDKDRNNVNDIINAVATLKDILKQPGVLNERQIYTLTALDILIYNSVSNNVKSASYDISVSTEHFKSGIKLIRQSKIEIPPLDFVIVRAKESANIPSNICGTFDLRVNMFCSGIILSNGPQIDPGYMGRFLCLLYNSSSKLFSLKENEGFSTVVFHALSSSTKRYSGKYQRKSSIEDYVQPYAEETISTNIQQINTIKENQGNLRKEINKQDEIFQKIETKFDDITNKVSKIDGNLPWFSSSLGLVLGIFSLLISFVIGYIFHNLNRDVGIYQSQIVYLEKDQERLNKRINELEKKLELCP